MKVSRIANISFRHPHAMTAACLFYLFLSGNSAFAQTPPANNGKLFRTISPYFHWVGKESVTEPVEVLVNNKKLDPGEYTYKTFKNRPHLRIYLEHLKISTIKIAAANTVLFEQNFIFARSVEEYSVPEEAVSYFFHTAAREKECAPCHHLDVRKTKAKPESPADSPCFACHRNDFTKTGSTHKSVTDKWFCLDCHDRAEKTGTTAPDTAVKYEVEKGLGTAPLCFRCHTAMQDQLADMEFIHGPVGEQACLNCHDPHDSDHPALLVRPATSLCVECHDMGDILDEPVVHKMIVDKGCTACHDPHGGNYPLQLHNAINPLCFTCHTDIERRKHNHPVSGHPVSARVNPANTSRAFSCTSCHNPHAAQHKNLLPTSETMMMCIKCHPRGR